MLQMTAFNNSLKVLRKETKYVCMYECMYDLVLHFIQRPSVRHITLYKIVRVNDKVGIANVLRQSRSRD